mmetsp:Transcript_110086/g.246054  ORF Transcript_110086/g.246054 Transcript_110086/m.246054 type:complete len:582 (-) Transcript_110086:786-2531(-)
MHGAALPHGSDIEIGRWRLQTTRLRFARLLPGSALCGASVHPLLHNTAEVYDTKLLAVHAQDVHVRFFGGRSHEVLTGGQVSGAAIPLPMHGFSELKLFGCLAPGWHLELHDPCVHAAAKDMLVIWGEDAHHVVEAGVQCLHRPVGQNFLPQVPDLAGVVEGGGGEYVGRAIAEAADIHNMFVHPLGPEKHLARTNIVNCDVGRDAAGQQEIVRAICAEGRKLRKLLDRVDALESWCRQRSLWVVLEERDVARMRGAANGGLRVVAQTNQAQHGAGIHDERRMNLLGLDVEDIQAAAFVAHKDEVRQGGMELKLSGPKRRGQKLGLVVRDDTLPRGALEGGPLKGQAVLVAKATRQCRRTCINALPKSARYTTVVVLLDLPSLLFGPTAEPWKRTARCWPRRYRHRGSLMGKPLHTPAAGGRFRAAQIRRADLHGSRLRHLPRPGGILPKGCERVRDLPRPALAYTSHPLDRLRHWLREQAAEACPRLVAKDVPAVGTSLRLGRSLTESPLAPDHHHQGRAWRPHHRSHTDGFRSHGHHFHIDGLALRPENLPQWLFVPHSSLVRAPRAHQLELNRTADVC